MRLPDLRGHPRLARAPFAWSLSLIHISLDGSVRKLNPNMLVIADEHRAVGLAGIMGGLNSEIVSDTADVVFESANFDGTTIRRCV